MKTRLLIWVCSCVLAANVYGQQRIQVHGHVLLHDQQVGLPLCPIILRDVHDASMLTQSFSNDSGFFQLAAPASDSFILTIRYMGYRTFEKKYASSEVKAHSDLGNLYLERSGITLATVEVKSAVLRKGDTLEYRANSFSLRTHAGLSELLEKLPGLEVFSDGKVQAQGQDITDIYVNGKPFYRGNPSLALSLLPAELIEKVQVVDSRGELAAFTGLKSGPSHKILNLIVKKKHLEQWSGRATAAAGTDKRYGIQVNGQQFAKEQQASFYTNLDNNQHAGDALNLLGAEGQQQSVYAGGHYHRDFTHKLNLDADVMLNHERVQKGTSALRQNVLEDSVWYYGSEGNTREQRFEQILNLNLNVMPDSLQLFSAALRMVHRQHAKNQQSIYQTSGESERMLNSGSSFSDATGNDLDLFATLNYVRKFTRGSLQVDATMNLQRGRMDNYASATNRYYSIDSVSVPDSLNQHLLTPADKLLLQLDGHYTFQFSPQASLRAGFLVFNQTDKNIRQTYAYNSAKQVYDLPIDSLSNRFRQLGIQLQPYLIFMGQKGRLEYSLGLRLNNFSIHYQDLGTEKHHQLDERWLIPEINVSWHMSPSKTLRLGYSSGLDLPAIQDVQPVLDNHDPLYVRMGNDQLKASRKVRLNGSYFTLNPESLCSFILMLDGGRVRDKIIQATWYDSLGRQVSQPVNKNGEGDVLLAAQSTSYLLDKKLLFKVNGSLHYYRDVNLVNGVPGWADRWNFSQGMGLDLDLKWLRVWPQVMYTYQYIHYGSSMSNLYRNSKWMLHFYSRVTLPWGIEMEQRVNYILNGGMSAGYNPQLFIWNASLNKNFLHDKLRFRVQGYDLLRQNKAIVRNIGNGYVEDVQSVVLQRFVIFGLTYFFN